MLWEIIAVIAKEDTLETTVKQVILSYILHRKLQKRNVLKTVDNASHYIHH